MKFYVFLIFPLLLSAIPVFGESHSENFGIKNPLEYILETDDNVFVISYEVNAKVIAMAIDPELTSLLIGLENTSDSIFVIDLKHDLINVHNNEFAILVNGLEVDYDIVSDSDSSTLSFFVPTFTEEVEIIGTHVIPEFPFGVIMGLVMMVSIMVAVSRAKIPAFRL